MGVKRNHVIDTFYEYLFKAGKAKMVALVACIEDITGYSQYNDNKKKTA